MKNIKTLTDDELRAQILAFGFDAGPVLKSTRRVYEIKLEKLLNEVHIEPPKSKKIVSEVPAVQVLAPHDVYEKYEDSEVTYEGYDDDGLDYAPVVELPIPKPVPIVNTYTSKSTISHNLPDYKRPPLNSSWRDLDLSRDYESPRNASLIHRKEAKVFGDQKNDVEPSKTKTTEKKETASKGSTISTCVQILLFLIICVIIFMVFSNMEPEGKNPFQQALPGK